MLTTSEDAAFYAAQIPDDWEGSYMTQDQDIKTTQGRVDSLEKKGTRWEIKLDGQAFSAWPNQVEENIVTSLRVGDYIIVGYTEKPAQDGNYLFKNINYITTGATPPPPATQPANQRQAYNPNGQRPQHYDDPKQHSIEKQVVFKASVDLYPILIQYNVIEPPVGGEGMDPMMEFVNQMAEISADLWNVLQGIGELPPVDAVHLGREVTKLKDFCQEKSWNRTFVFGVLGVSELSDWFVADARRTADEAIALLEKEDDLPW